MTGCSAQCSIHMVRKDLTLLFIANVEQREEGMRQKNRAELRFRTTNGQQMEVKTVTVRSKDSYECAGEADEPSRMASG